MTTPDPPDYQPLVAPGARHLLHGATVDFAAVRAELGEPEHFPTEVTDAADAIAGPGVNSENLPDATHLDLVTVDPAGSRDLDQAFALERHGEGYRLWYAIADVATFVAPRGPIDREAWSRGETRYCPDISIPLHPRSLSEGAASLLPDVDRPAALWRIDLDADGEIVPGGVEVRRSRVRSRAQYSYESLEAALTSGTTTPSAALLGEVGALRLTAARRRHAIDLPIPEQRVEPANLDDPDGRYTVTFRRQRDVEMWNAQLSLLTGMAAAQLMIQAGIGVLRTLPEPDAQTLTRVHTGARALGIDWPSGAPPGDVLAAIDPSTPAGAAFADLAAELLRGASYRAFDGAAPPAADRGHAGIAAEYAHVTAPLRRLVDRYGTEICLAICAGVEPPAWVREALPNLPDTMTASGRAAHALERACVDLAEAWLLRPRVGETFTGGIVDVGRRFATIVLDDPAVRARCDGNELPLGERVHATLVEADVTTRAVRFHAEQPPARPG